jgi:hypothetical protein
MNSNLALNLTRAAQAYGQRPALVVDALTGHTKK